MWWWGNMPKYFLLIFLFMLTACGYAPIYGKHDSKNYGQEDFLSYVAIENIPNREGQILRNALIDRFYRDGRPANPAYKLFIIDLKENLRDLDITKGSDSTRGQLKLEAKIRLIDTVTQETLLEHDIRSIASYNILDSEFTNRVSEENTRQNVLNDLARQVELQLSLYFKQQTAKMN
jgi:LPS-assembly lipoprotein